MSSPVDWSARLRAELAELIADLDDDAREQARADLAAGRGRLAQLWPDLIVLELTDDVLVTAWSAIAPDPHTN